MSYQELLSKYIQDSGLSLRKIASECKKLGVSVTASYISRLQAGKMPPPSEEISKAIADVCQQDSQKLIMQGYIDKAPEPVQKMFEYSEKWSTIVWSIYSGLNRYSPTTKEDFLEYFNGLSIKEQTDLVFNFYKNARRVTITPNDNSKAKYEYIRGNSLPETSSSNEQNENKPLSYVMKDLGTVEFNKKEKEFFDSMIMAPVADLEKDLEEALPLAKKILSLSNEDKEVVLRIVNSLSETKTNPKETD